MKRARKPPTRKILVLPVGGVVFFPGCVTFVVLDKSGFRQKTVDKAMAGDRMLLLLSERAGAKADPETKDIAGFGTMGRITEIETLADGSSRVRIDGVQRAKPIRLTRREGVFEAQVHTIKERSGKLGQAAGKALNYAMDLFFGKYIDYCDAAGQGFGYMLHCAANPEGNHEIWCDIIAGNLGPSVLRGKRQELLETLSPLKRIRLLGKVLKERIEEFAGDPELRKRVLAQRRQAREDLRRAQQEREAEMASKLEKLKKDMIEMLLLPAKPRRVARRVVEFPIMPIRDTIVLPSTQTPFVVGRAMSLAALNQALATDKRIFLATQHDAQVEEPKPKEIYRIGTIAHIDQTLKLPDDNIKLLVRGLQTGRALKIDRRLGYFRGQIETESEHQELTPETINVLNDTWELVRHHSLPIADQQRLLEAFNTDGPLEYIRQAIDMITATLKPKS